MPNWRCNWVATESSEETQPYILCRHASPELLADDWYHHLHRVMRACTFGSTHCHAVGERCPAYLRCQDQVMGLPWWKPISWLQLGQGQHTKLVWEVSHLEVWLFTYKLNLKATVAQFLLTTCAISLIFFDCGIAVLAVTISCVSNIVFTGRPKFSRQKFDGMLRVNFLEGLDRTAAVIFRSEGEIVLISGVLCSWDFCLRFQLMVFVQQQTLLGSLLSSSWCAAKTAYWDAGSRGYRGCSDHAAAPTSSGEFVHSSKLCSLSYILCTEHRLLDW